MSQKPVWTTPAGVLFTATENIVTSTSVIASGTNIVYSLISGALPNGLLLSSTGTIHGSPGAVQNINRNTFVVRAENTSGVVDRTFSIDITGITTPEWTTSRITNIGTSTYLNVGIQGEAYAINNQYVQFPLTVSTSAPLTPSGTTFTYYLDDGANVLPPGLTLSEDGVISGFVKDTLAVNTSTNVPIPNNYKFVVTVTDGVAQRTKEFSILVADPYIVRNLDTATAVVYAGIITTNTNYAPPVQFIKGTELGTIRAQNNQTLDVSVYDPYPNFIYGRSGVVYQLDAGTIPTDLTLDNVTGLITGYVPYQPAYTKNYSLTISASRVISSATNLVSVDTVVTATNTFTVAVKGNIESTIQWVSDSNLGSITIGEVSNLSVVAENINSDYVINYNLENGNLPPGLNLERDGSISGTVNYGSTTGTYTATISASDVYSLSNISSQFAIDVTKYNDKRYTKIYCKPFLAKAKRDEYKSFISNTFTFDPALLYRYFDPNFGVQSDIKLILEFGIEQLNLRDITPALTENFYRRRLQFGDIKVAAAKDISGTVLYEVVYVDVVDPSINLAGESISNVLIEPGGEFYFPASIPNQKTRLSQLTLPDYTTVDINEALMPKFMRSPQGTSYQNIGYMSIIPLCYAMPGMGASVVKRIKLSGFDFKMIDFDIDRIIVENSLDNDAAKYLLLGRQSISDALESDLYIEYPSGFTLPLDNSEHLTRE